MFGKPTYEKAQRRNTFWGTWGIPAVLLGWLLGVGSLFFTLGMTSEKVAVAQTVFALLAPIVFVALFSEHRNRQFVAAELANVPMAVGETEEA